MPSIADLLRWGDCALKEAPAADAVREARLLLAGAMGVDLAWVLAHPESEAGGTQGALFTEWVQQRAAGKPIAYVVGHREFYGRDFIVSPSVLIPRPETELLIDQGLRLLAPRLKARRDQRSAVSGRRSTGGGWGLGVGGGVFPLNHEPMVCRESLPERPAPLLADVGTGSGCIAVTLAAEIPGAFVVATDISEAAIRVAKANAARHGVTARIQFERVDLLPEEREGFDALFSNPPYIATGDARLADEVRNNEPPMALFAGESGLEMYQRIVPLAARRLKVGGWLLLELGYQSEEGVRALLSDAVWAKVQVFPDLQGISRCLVAQRGEPKARLQKAGAAVNSF